MLSVTNYHLYHSKYSNIRVRGNVGTFIRGGGGDSTEGTEPEEKRITVRDPRDKKISRLGTIN